MMKEDFNTLAAQLIQAQTELGTRQNNFFKALLDGVNIEFTLTPAAEKMVKDAGVTNIQFSLPGVLLWPASGDELAIESNGVELVFTVLSRRLRLMDGKPPTIVFRVDQYKSGNNGRSCFFKPTEESER